MTVPQQPMPRPMPAGPRRMPGNQPPPVVQAPAVHSDPDSPPPSKPGFFLYYDGYKWRYGDPFVIDARYYEAGETNPTESYYAWMREGFDAEGKPIQDLPDDVLEKNYALRMKGGLGLLPNLLKAFDIKPADESTGEGLRADQVIDIWTRFNLFKTKVKKNTDAPPTSATGTA
jgi:hypothetical protein